MISTNALSLFLFEHNDNRFCGRNLCLIQELIRSDKPDGTKFKQVCVDFPNVAINPKRATPGEIQVTYGHTSIGNKSLGKTVTAFALAGSLEAPTVVSINADVNLPMLAKISVSQSRRSSSATPFETYPGPRIFAAG